MMATPVQNMYCTGVAIPDRCKLRQVKYLNNIVEQDQRFIKRRFKPGLGFFSFKSSWQILQGTKASSPNVAACSYS
jgi:transposase-like protein